MRRGLLFLMVAVASLLSVACFEVEERISLTADGSGTQVTTVDFSALLSNPFMQGALEEEGGEALRQHRLDSAFSLYQDLAPANPQWTQQEADLVRRASGRIKVDLETGTGMVVTTFPFDDLDQLERFTAIMREANEPEDGKEEMDNPFGGLGQGGIVISDYTQRKRKLVQQTATAATLTKILGEEEMGDEEMGMLRGLLEDAGLRFVIEFPGNIRRVEGYSGHHVHENTLTVDISLLELIDRPDLAAAALSGSVKFRK